VSRARGEGRLVDALLRSPEPSIRWKTRVHVLGDSPRSKAIRALEDEIRRSPRVRSLLSGRGTLGQAGTRRRVYYKWQGLQWVLASLADLGYPRGDEALHPLRDRVLELWLGPQYFREYEAKTKAAGYNGSGVPAMRGRYRRCASQQGNALYAITVLGIADEGADALAERLLHWQWPDGGWNCDRDPEADTSSFMETLTPMLGLDAYARERRSASAKKAARRASEVFLTRRLFKRRSDGKVIQPDFVALHYPLYWHYDVLGGLKAMARIGRIRDPRCRDALDLLESKRLPDGGWAAERKYYSGRSRTFKANAEHVDWGGTSTKRMNEWVTVDALAVLQAAGRIRV
jgi:hypothetical protein